MPVRMVVDLACSTGQDVGFLTGKHGCVAVVELRVILSLMVSHKGVFIDDGDWVWR